MNNLAPSKPVKLILYNSQLVLLGPQNLHRNKTGHVIHVGKTQNSYRILVAKLLQNVHLKDQEQMSVSILWILGRWVVTAEDRGKWHRIMSNGNGQHLGFATPGIKNLNTTYSTRWRHKNFLAQEWATNIFLTYHVWLLMILY